MSQDIIELSPQVKNDFDGLCLRMHLDKVTRLRSIYIFDDFLKKRTYSMVPTNKKNYALYLRVAALVASRSMVVPTIEGREIRGNGLRLTHFIDHDAFS
jgi:hypothetical protein